MLKRLLLLAGLVLTVAAATPVRELPVPECLPCTVLSN